jgi:hypothetical protein
MTVITNNEPVSLRGRSSECALLDDLLSAYASLHQRRAPKLDRLMPDAQPLIAASTTEPMPQSPVARSSAIR